MSLLPTLSECLGCAEGLPPLGKLEALDLWLSRRGDATISVGVVTADALRRCTIMAHGQTFSAARRGEGFAASWSAIAGALGACEQFEAATFGHVG
jgi:hypothetical protein